MRIRIVRKPESNDPQNTLLVGHVYELSSDKAATYIAQGFAIEDKSIECVVIK